jgi:hypothetical protein
LDHGKPHRGAISELRIEAAAESGWLSG